MEEGIVRDDIPGSRNFRSRDYWVRVRELGERGSSLNRAVKQWVEEPAQWHQRTGRARKERGPGFVGTQ